MIAIPIKANVNIVIPTVYYKCQSYLNYLKNIALNIATNKVVQFLII